MTYEEILKFHGHECPGIAIGYRMAEAAMVELALLRAADEELVAIVENDACGVDAVQCLTGCTFGKGNLIFRDYGKHVYTLYSRKFHVGVRVSFNSTKVPPDVHERRDEFTRWILATPSEQMLTIDKVHISEPEPAKIQKSIACSFCGEEVMETRLKQLRGEPVCIPCLLKYNECEQSYAGATLKSAAFQAADFRASDA